MPHDEPEHSQDFGTRWHLYHEFKTRDHGQRITRIERGLLAALVLAALIVLYLILSSRGLPTP